MTLVSFSPASVQAGAMLSVSDSVANLGASAAHDFSVGIYLSSDADIQTTDVLLGFRTIGNLVPGQVSSGGGTLSIPIATAPGTWYLGVIADNQGQVAELLESNNTAQAPSALAITPAILPDLVPTFVSVGQTSVNSGDTIDVSDTVKNQGTVAAGAFEVGVYLSHDALITTADTLLGLRSLPGLAAGASSSAGDPLTIPSNTASGSYFVGVIADRAGTVVESDELNNSRAAIAPTAVITPPRPDLVVQSVSFTPSSADSGTPIEASETVANVGQAAAGTFDVGIYLSPDAEITTADTLLGRRSLASLQLGASASGMGNVLLPAEMNAGTYYVGAIADDGADVGESNEDNNALAALTTIHVTVPPRPDLTVNSVSFSPSMVDTTLSQTIHVTEAVSNIGVLDAAGFRVAIYLSSNNVISTSDALLGYRTLAGLAVGDGSGSNGDLAVPAGLSPGSYFIGAIVDDQDEVLEQRESNNILIASGMLDVVSSPTPMPDLVVQDVSFAPHQVDPGGTIQVLNEVRNQGTLSAGTFQVGVYISSDPTISTDDLKIGERTVFQLGINFGSASSAPLGVPLGLTPGTYYVGAIADIHGTVAESQEANNSLRASGTLVVILPPAPMPDLSVTAIGFTPHVVALGGALQLSSTVRNLGDQPAAAFRVGFYLSSDSSLSTQDIVLGFQSLGGLPAGQSFVGAANFNLPASVGAGTWYVGAIADDDGLITESLETNNALVATSTLHVQ